MNSKTFRRAIALGFALALVAEPALAADDWTKPILDFLEVLTSGLGKLGTAVLGIGIIAIGLWAAWSGRMDWNRFAWALVGGVLVMIGPTIVSSLFAA
jgi:type IV secretory pathway VirB2 component (pilin)